jgi:hypothetical protein
MADVTSATKHDALKAHTTSMVASTADPELGPSVSSLDAANLADAGAAPPHGAPAARVLPQRQLLRLQRAAGNQAVARLLTQHAVSMQRSVAPAAEPHAEPHPDVEPPAAREPAPVARDPAPAAREPAPDPAPAAPDPAPVAPPAPAVMRSGIIQRGITDSILGKVAGWAKEIPGYHLMTLILGKDPISGAVVERNAMNVVHGVLSLVPGGNKVFENLQQSGALERFFDWVSGEFGKLGLSFDSIKQLFSKGWDALSITDLLDPMGAWNKVKAIFGPPLGGIKDFAIAAGKKVLEFILEGVLKLAGPLGDQVMAMLKKGADVFDKIVKDPIGFLGNLLKAVKAGFEGFMGNILEHLKNGLMGWLFGALAGAGLVLPKAFDLKGILSIVLQVLGLTYQNLRGKLVAALGDKTVGYIEKAVDFVKTLATEGLAGAWKMIVEWVGNLKDMVIGAVQDWVVTSIVKAAVTKLITMFNPVGAIIQGIITIYNTITFFIERAQQIAAVATSLFDSVGRIAAGDVAGAAAYVEQTMGKTVPVIISFLASLIGLGGIGNTIRGIIAKIQAPINKALDKAVGFITTKAKSIVAKVKGLFNKGEKPGAEGKQTDEVREKARADLASQLPDIVESSASVQPILSATMNKYRAQGLQSIEVTEDKKNAPGEFAVIARATDKAAKKMKAAPKLQVDDLDFTDMDTGTALIAKVRGTQIGPFRSKGADTHAEDSLLADLRENWSAYVPEVKDSSKPLTVNISVTLTRSPCSRCTGRLNLFETLQGKKGYNVQWIINTASFYYGEQYKQKEKSQDAIKRLQERGHKITAWNLDEILQEIGIDPKQMKKDVREKLVKRVEDMQKQLEKIEAEMSAAKVK